MARSLASFIGLRYAMAKRGGMLVAFLSRISVFGLILGVALLITVLSVMNGFEKELEEQILKLVPHTSVVHFDGMQDWQAVDGIVAQHPAVESSAPFIHINGLISVADNVEAVLVHAILPERELQLSTLANYVQSGDLSSLDGERSTIAIGDELATRLNLGLGGKIRLLVPLANAASATPIPKIAEFQLTALFHTGTELDQSLAVIHLHQGQDLVGYQDQVQGLRLALDDVFRAPQISREILDLLPPGYYTRDWHRTHGNLYEAIQLSRSLVTLIIFMVIAVAVFNIVSALVMVVTDKTEDIAILKTMGAEKSDVIKIFLIHGIAIGVIGTLIGVLLGVALSLSLPHIIDLVENLFQFKFLNTSVYPIDYLPTDLRLGDVLVIACVAVFMSIVAVVYPAWRASRVEPASALRWH